MRIAEERTRKEYDVSLAGLQVFFCLLGFGDEANSSNRHVRVRLLYPFGVQHLGLK